MIFLQHPKAPDTMGQLSTSLTQRGGAQSHTRAKETEKSQDFFQVFGFLLEDLARSSLTPNLLGFMSILH